MYIKRSSLNISVIVLAAVRGVCVQVHDFTNNQRLTASDSNVNVLCYMYVCTCTFTCVLEYGTMRILTPIFETASQLVVGYYTLF